MLITAPTDPQTFTVTPSGAANAEFSDPVGPVDNTGRRTVTIENLVADALHQRKVIAASDVTIDGTTVTLADSTTVGEVDLTAAGDAAIEVLGGAAVSPALRPRP